MIKFAVEKRFSTDIAFTAEIDCAEDAPRSWKLRLAVLWAIKSEANLSEANLSWADLSEANLSEADLSWANLSEANLSEANLSWANLSKANLSWANLSEANLSKADLLVIRGDFWQILLQNQNEVEGLLKAVREGKIDGSVYTGECCCLMGTIANVRGCDVDTLEKNSSRPAERFFMGISEGHTPETNPVSKIVEQWIVEFQTLLNNGDGE